MIKPGICSVTFREKSPEEVIELSVEAGLKAIEWGADVHVPPHDLDNAKRVGVLTREAGLEVAGYGSYFFAFDKGGEPPMAFEPVLAAAVALGAPTVRIWGGSLSIDKTEDYFETVVQRTREAVAAAATKGIKVAYEFHQNTFTETLEGALKLMDAVNHPDLYTYWQPPHGSGLEQRLKEVEAFKNRLPCVHVFHWAAAAKPPYERLALSDGIDLWQPCLDAIASIPGDPFALLEFVRNDSVKQFKNDAATLLKLIESSEGK